MLNLKGIKTLNKKEQMYITGGLNTTIGANCVFDGTISVTTPFGTVTSTAYICTTPDGDTYTATVVTSK